MPVPMKSHKSAYFLNIRLATLQAGRAGEIHFWTFHIILFIFYPALLRILHLQYKYVLFT